MKQIGKKIVAIMLTTAMVVQLVAGIAPTAKEVEAGNTEWDYSFEIARGASASTMGEQLNDKFDVYEYGYALNGIPAGAEGTKSEPGSVTTTYTGARNNGYLKFSNLTSKSAFLTYDEKMCDFTAEFSYYRYWNQISGLMFGCGENGAFPISFDGDNTNDTGVVIYISGDNKGGKVLNIGGAIKRETASYLGGTTDGTDYGTIGDLDGIANISGKSAFTAVPDSELTYTSLPADFQATIIVVEVKDDLLTVYEKTTPNNKVTVELTNYYQGGYVSLFNSKNASNNTCFKSFGITKLSDYSFGISKYEAYGTSLDAPFNVYNYDAQNTTVLKSFGEPSDATMAATKDHGGRNHGYLKLMKSGSNATTELATMTYMTDVTNFRTEVTFYSYIYQSGGIIIGGEAGTFPISFDDNPYNDKGVVIYLDETAKKINIAGAIDKATATSTSGTGFDSHWNFSGTAGIKGKTNITDKTFVGTQGTVLDSDPSVTLVITVQDGVLSVYEKDTPTNVVSVNLLDSYQGGKVSLFAHTHNVAFKSFAIKALPDTEVNPNYSFNLTKSQGIGTSLNKAFNIYNYSSKATTAETAISTSIGEPSDSTMATMGTWNTTNNGYLKLKKANNGSWLSAMTYGSTVTNFRAELTYYSAEGNRAGIMFGGEAGTFPITFDDNLTNDKGVMLFLEKRSGIGIVLNIGGAIVPSTATSWDGSTFGTQSYLNGTSSIRGNAALTDKIMSGEGTVADDDAGITLVVTVNNGLLSVYEKDSPEKVITVQLAHFYEGGTVSMFTEHANTSFRAFSIEQYPDPEIDSEIDPNLINFDDLDLSTLNGWTSRIYNRETGDIISAQDITDQWFTGANYEEILGSEWNPTFNKYRNTGLKPKIFNNEDTPYILTSADDYENFESYFTYYQHSGRYSMIIGGEGKYPSAISDSAVHVYIHGSKNANDEVYYELRVVGAIDLDSAVGTGKADGKILSLEDTARLNITQFGYTQFSASGIDPTTVHVKVENGVLTASVGDIDAAIQVNLASTYEHGKISLSAVCSAYGGFKYLRVSELDSTPAPESGTVNYNMTSKNEYAVITVGTELPYSALNAELKFDNTKYDFVRVTSAGDNYRMLNDGVTVEGDTVTINAYTNQSEKYVDLYFKTKDNSRAKDFKNFKVTNKEMKVVGGKSVASIAGSVALSYDYFEDKTLDIADLISTDSADNRATLRKVLIGKNASPLINKSALFLGDSIMNAACDHSGWYGRLEAEYGMDCDEYANDGWALVVTTATAYTDKDGIAYAGRQRIISQLEEAPADKDYDFVVLEGGVNDVLIKGHTDDQVPATLDWGDEDANISADITSYDTTTIAGAMQELIVAAKNKYPNAQLVYIINSEFGCSADNKNRFVKLVQKVCDEHGIPYVNLSDTDTYKELEVINDKNGANFKDFMVDNIHPNAKSYDITAPIVAAKMEEVLLNSK